MTEVNTENKSGKYSEMTSISTGSTGATSSTRVYDDSSVSKTVSFDTGEVLHIDQPIEKVEENHYVFRRGSTEVHVQTLDTEASQKFEEYEGNSHGLITLLSGILALIMFLITLVIKISAALTETITSIMESEYMLSLYSIAYLWLIYFLFRGKFFRKEILFLKNNQSSNRWLKGVVGVFGLAIILKDGLEFLSQLISDSNTCHENKIKAAMSVVHAAFVIGQVSYIARYSKVYIRNCSIGSRTGLMFIIAVNLSIWIASIVDETLIALDLHSTTVDTSEGHSSGEMTTIWTNLTDTHDTGSDDHSNPCECHTEFCTTVHAAEKFLFPFLVEFSLVASTILYVTWSNIGKKPPPCEGVTKPSYKFYSSFGGGGLGLAALFFTVVIMIILATLPSDATPGEENYFTASTQNIVMDSFMIIMETSMLIGCFVGFYLFHRIPRPLESTSILDNVLLFICVIGPLTLGIFSLVAVIAGEDNKISGWVLALGSPLADIIQCLVQLILILYGLQREPILSANSKETAENLRRSIAQQLRRNYSPADDEGAGYFGKEAHDNKTFLRSRSGSITSVVSALAHPKPYHTSELHANDADVTNSDHNQVTSPPQIIITDESSESSNGPNDIEVNLAVNEKHDRNVPDDKVSNASLEVLGKQALLKIVSETRIARPDSLRLWLRGVMMFLLLSNASLWMFLSLNGTAFITHSYQYLFYGDSAWTTILMICRPLSIFYRMHSAGCLFEIWSFA